LHSPCVALACPGSRSTIDNQRQYENAGDGILTFDGSKWKRSIVIALG